MSTYELGRIGLRLCGEYVENTVYEELDVVTYGGSSYAALQRNENILPTDAENWTLLAQGNTVTTMTYMDALPETGTLGQLVFVPAS